MRGIILKTQLFFLFFATIVNMVYFHLNEKLPDNILKISSTSKSVSTINYYLSSFLVVVGHYIGPWVFLSFFSFSLFYSLVFSKRDSILDVFNIFFNLGFFLGIGYFFFPSFLGESLINILSMHLGSLKIFFLILMCSALIVLSSSKKFSHSFSSPLENIVKTLRRLFSIPSIGKKEKTKEAQQLLISMSSKEQILPLRKKFFSVMDKKNNKKNLQEKGFNVQNKKEDINTQSKDVPFSSESLNEKPEINKLQKSEKEDQDQEQEINLHPLNLLKDDKEVLTYDQKSRDLIAFMTSSKDVKKERSSEDEYFERIIRCLEGKFQEFKINGRIANVLKGPVVDTFELELGAGVKVSRVTSITEDLSLALRGVLIRIVYPMKGKSTIGIEVPREPRDMIFLGEILTSSNFRSTHYYLPLAMGKNAFGEVFVVDLASMPHMLVAGSTGAGKSVFINTLLVSLLIKKSPQQMKLLLIDPKQLELSFYSTLPHLILPVITDPVDTSMALLWVCQEMERRYSILKEVGVRNIENFNEKIQRLPPAELKRIRHLNESLYRESGQDELPYLVVIVDEFADLILSRKGREIEESICRLAAKARAAGIHLVIATQRPSVDVITGLIKANFPTRISFRVTSSIDSRTILNALGAEKLLGKGDMLYKYGIEMLRLHSAFVDEVEIEELIKKFDFGPLEYDERAMHFIKSKKNLEINKEDSYYVYHDPLAEEELDQEFLNDTLYREAIKIVVEHKVASASMLQRKLKIGYNRAANLVEVMEAEGVIGPPQGSRPRKVLILSEDQP